MFIELSTESNPPLLRGVCRWVATLATAVAVVGLLSGCATTDDKVADPFEGVNRTVYSFNKAVDTAILKPVAQGYQAVVPDPIDQAITNFFSNLADIRNAVNNFLQLKLTRAFEDVARVAVNSTLGLGGFIDLASGIGLTKHDEDFGQTLGRWGIDTGPYLVVPFYGPSSLRDAVGLAADTVFLDPVTQVNDVPVRNAMWATRAVDRRADLLEAEKIIEVGVLDEYDFIRDAYLQRRRSLVYDGDPPPDDS